MFFKMLEYGVVRVVGWGVAGYMFIKVLEWGVVSCLFIRVQGWALVIKVRVLWCTGGSFVRVFECGNRWLFYCQGSGASIMLFGKCWNFEAEFDRVLDSWSVGTGEGGNSTKAVRVRNNEINIKKKCRPQSSLES